MDDCEQQILHEYQHAEERGQFSMSAASSASKLSDVAPATPSAATNTLLPSPPQNAPCSTMEALQSSLLSGKFSDLTIAHGNRRWKAHKVDVCSQSPVLEARIEKLKDNSPLYLTEYDYDAVCRMIEYLYTTDYTTLDLAPSFSLDTHTAVFVLACTLSIPGLAQLSVQRYRHAITYLVSSLDIYFASVRYIYATTSPLYSDLRVAVVEAAISEMGNLLREGTEARKGFMELTREVEQFQADVYTLLVVNPTRPLEVMGKELCEGCGPREEGDGYEVTTECKGCGEERTLRFQ